MDTVPVPSTTTSSLSADNVELGLAKPQKSETSSSSSSCSCAEGITDAGMMSESTTLPPLPTLTFFSWGCSRSLVLALLAYTLALTLATLLAQVQRHIGLVLLSVLPGVAMMTYMQRLFARSVLRREMVLTFFFAIIYMSPLVVLENTFFYVTLTRTHLDGQGEAQHSTQAITWGYHTLSAFVRAFLVASIFEETAKYLALCRLRKVPYVSDPRAMICYGLVAGAAFGTVENLFIYAFSYGIENLVARGFLSVPLHAMTGMLAGCALAEDRFVRPGTYPWYKVIATPFLVHGTFDFLNFMLADDFGEVSLVLEVLLVVGGFAYARHWLVKLMKVLPVEDNVHARIYVPSALDATVLQEDDEEEEEDEGAGVRLPPPPPVVAEGKGGDLQLPTTKYIATVVVLSCVLCTGMLLFLYLWEF